MSDPQFFTAPDGTEMVIISRARYDALLEAEEDLEDVVAAEEGAASLAAEGGIPMDVLSAITEGVHPIVAWRKHHGLTQASLAEAVGLTQAAIARLEKAPTGSGRAETIAAIATALDAPRWTLETSSSAPRAEKPSIPLHIFGADVLERTEVDRVYLASLLRTAWGINADETADVIEEFQAHYRRAAIQ